MIFNKDVTTTTISTYTARCVAVPDVKWELALCNSIPSLKQELSEEGQGTGKEAKERGTVGYHPITEMSNRKSDETCSAYRGVL